MWPQLSFPPLNLWTIWPSPGQERINHLFLERRMEMTNDNNDTPKKSEAWTRDLKADAAYAQEYPRWKLKPEQEAAALELIKKFEDREVTNE